ncbi:hypothetical protein LTR12_010599 [Friedmanniomyces endolithicus]|nr:hypothetical protein LTR12_010599 [Friedmanniomyces endolithicus]
MGEIAKGVHTQQEDTPNRRQREDVVRIAQSDTPTIWSARPGVPSDSPHTLSTSPTRKQPQAIIYLHPSDLKAEQPTPEETLYPHSSTPSAPRALPKAFQPPTTTQARLQRRPLHITHLRRHPAPQPREPNPPLQSPLPPLLLHHLLLLRRPPPTLGTYNWALVVSEPPPGVNDQGSWGRYLMTGVTMGTTLVVSIFGTVLILAPVGMVGRISLLRSKAIGVMAEQGVRLPPMLSVEMEAPLPFMTRKTYELAPSKALLDRNVSAVDIELTSIPLKNARAFTSDSAHLSAGTPKLQHPPRDAVSRFIRTLTRDIRRMFYREGFAYLRSDKYGNWKVDLQHCELLDQGRPLDRLTMADPSSGKGPVAWLKRLMVA